MGQLCAQAAGIISLKSGRKGEEKKDTAEKEKKKEKNRDGKGES